MGDLEMNAPNKAPEERNVYRNVATTQSQLQRSGIIITTQRTLQQYR
jgi:hypothetical protein